MKRILPTLIALTAATLAAAQARLTVTLGGRPAGYSTVSQKILPDGVKLVELRLELGSEPRKIQLRMEAKYDAKGLPMRKFQEMAVAGKVQRHVIATFNKDGASIVLNEDGKRSVRNVTLAAAAPRATMSEFWFMKGSPRPGEIEEAYQFNMDSLTWELVHTRYAGKKSLKIEGRAIEVHEVVSKRGDRSTTSYLDGDGLPVLIDQGDMKMMRLWSK